MSERRRYMVFESELGWIAAACGDRRLDGLTFGHSTPLAALRHLGDPAAEPSPEDGFMRSLAARLKRFARGDCGDRFLDVSLAVDGMTTFQRVVTAACRRIPVGETLSYGELARRAGHARAARAVGQVMAKNRFPLIVPCHRVVSARTLGGFSAPFGSSMKRRLLSAETAYADGMLSEPGRNRSLASAAAPTV